MFTIKTSTILMDEQHIESFTFTAESYQELIRMAKQINHENVNSWNWTIVNVSVKTKDSEIGTERCVQSFRQGNAIIACAKSLIFRLGLRELD